MPEITYRINLLTRDEDGFLVDTDEDFGPEDYMNTVPAPGDLIMSPGVSEERDFMEATNRTIYEVVERYFHPGGLMVRDGRYVYVCLVVQPRRGHASEAILPDFG